MRLFHISDLHFQAEIPLTRLPFIGWRRAVAQTEYRLLHRRERFLDVPATVSKLLSLATAFGADHLLVSGDLTALALPEEFEEAQRHLASWSGRMTIIPGNHDRYTPDAARKKLFEQAFVKELGSDLSGFETEGAYPIVKLVGDSGAVIGLSSARVPLSPGFAAGWVGSAQRRGLATILARPELQNRSVFVACHHAPYRRDGRADRLNHGLVDAGKLLQILRNGGALALGHGHIHQRYRIDIAGQPPVFCAGSSTEQGRQGYFQYVLSDRTIAAEPIFLSHERMREGLA